MKRPLARKKEYLLLAAIFALALFSRAFRFGAVPYEINQDEAFAGYEAWAILNYGVDSSLHAYPVYLTAWGSGMNALESYLMLPFIALFGLKVWVIRLPQLIAALLAVLAAYGVGRRSGGRRLGLIFALALAVCPWHIMLARWGLESNLAPEFLLFGLYFFLRGLKDGRFLCLSALMYGLSLYTYAAIWPVLPLILLAQIIYAAALGKLRAGKWRWISAAILAILALPLLLFMLVNYGYIDEINLPWISVPKLLYMRSGEVSLKNIPKNLGVMLEILLWRSDGLISNSPESFGVFYIISLPFMAAGLCIGAVRTVRSLKSRAFAPEALMLIWLLGGVLLCALVEVNLNRMNILLMPLVYFEALGIRALCRASRRAGAAALAVYLVLFCCFEAYYFTDYAGRVSSAFTPGAGEAIRAAETHDGTVYVCSDISYSKLLFYSETPPRDFAATVEYEYYPAAFLSPKSFGRYSYEFEPSEPEDLSACYIIPAYTDCSAYEALGFTIESYGSYLLAYRE